MSEKIHPGAFSKVEGAIENTVRKVNAPGINLPAEIWGGGGRSLWGGWFTTDITARPATDAVNAKASRLLQLSAKRKYIGVLQYVTHQQMFCFFLWFSRHFDRSGQLVLLPGGPRRTRRVKLVVGRTCWATDSKLHTAPFCSLGDSYSQHNTLQSERARSHHIAEACWEAT